MSTKPWWEYHSPAEMSIDCSGRKHLVRWQDGELVLLDHNDPEGERTLAALGGDACECVEILGSWERHRADLRLLVLASRGPSDPIIHIDELGRAGMSVANFVGGTSRMRSRRTVIRGVSGWVGHSPLARGRGGLPQSAGAADPDELLKLLQLGGGLSDRLLATLLADWTERISGEDGRCEAERPSLTVALYGRVAVALRTWLNEPDLAITLDMIDPSDQPDISRGPEGIHVRLPFRWLIDVWARGVSVILGRFAMQLLDAEDERQRVLTVSSDLRDIRPVTISIG
jgi:hypothetical protein